MAIYTPPQAQPTPALTGPTSDAPARSRTGTWAALSFLVLSAAALLVAIWTPQTVGQPQFPVATAPAHTASEINAAKVKACAAWATSAGAMTTASNLVGATQPGWDNPDRIRARANDARVTLVETAYMRTQLDPATPDPLRSSVERYNALSFALQDATAHRLGKLEDKIIDEQNIVVKQLESLCAQP